nr:16S rRNA (guanine(527)-N(7))-methyltransferase RsmG [Bacteroidota bacterium]
MKIIQKYFPDLTSGQQVRFGQLQDLYREWNSKINVISRKDLENLYERHILHSLAIAKVIDFKDKTSILDAGTGGGFPGIPLAILFPQVRFLLADSIGKKIRVVQEVSDALGLNNVIARQARIEDIPQQFDFVVSRAVTRLPDFLEWCKGKIRKRGFNKLPNGILYLKGGDITEELKGVKGKYRIWNCSEFFQEDFFETKKVIYCQAQRGFQV